MRQLFAGWKFTVSSDGFAGISGDIEWSVKTDREEMGDGLSLRLMPGIHAEVALSDVPG